MTTPSERDWDAEFAEITAHLGETLGQERPLGATRSVVGSSSPADTRGQEPIEPATPRPAPGVPGFHAQWRMPDPTAETDTAPTDWDDSSAPEPESSDADHDGADDFVPPTPAPINTADPTIVIMLGALVIGPLWLLYLLFFDREAATFWWGCAGGLLVLGFGLAVARQPQTRDEDNPDDDGAQV